MIFEDRYFSRYILLTELTFHFLIAFSSWEIGQYGIVIICFRVDDVIHFEINFSLLIKPFPYIKKLSNSVTEKYSNNVRTKKNF